MVDSAGSIDSADISGSDIIIIAVPVLSSIDIIKSTLENTQLDSRALVMDVGSVKGAIAEAAAGCRFRDRFIGCHPMAGSEKSGFEFAASDLYEGSSVLITPSGFNSSEDLRRASDFWESLGARCSFVTPEEHDRRVAYTSHLPHFCAASLTASLKGYIDGSQIRPGEIADYIGNGFRDSTRIAGGSADMWRDIALMNRKNIIEAIELMKERLSEVSSLISAAGDDDRPLVDYLRGIKQVRDSVK
jgi:prephenate dehydrogenase